MACLLEVLLRSIPNDYGFKKTYLDENSNEIETLILGNSHTYYGLNPAFFTTKTFNASHISQSLDYDFEIIKKYQNELNRLKTIVLPISYFSLFEKLEESEESWRVKNYNIYYDIKTSNVLRFRLEILSNTLATNLKRLYSYYIAGNSERTCSGLGWGTNFSSENALDLSASGKSAALRHTIKKYQPILKEQILVLNNLVEWCADREVKLILFTPPAHLTYRQNLDAKQLNTLERKIEKIVLKNSHCHYTNLLSDENFFSKDFYDADHLSEIGAEKLSNIANRLINSLK